MVTDRCVVIGCLLIDLMMLIDNYRSMIVRFASPATRGFLSPLLSLSHLISSRRKKTSGTRVLPKWIWLNQENFSILKCPTKPKGVTNQMKALDEYFLMVTSVHVVAEQSSCFCKLYMFHWTEKNGSERVIGRVRTINTNKSCVSNPNLQLVLIQLNWFEIIINNNFT